MSANLDSQIHLQSFLRQRFAELQNRNAQFSLRAFARKLGLSPSATSEILRGQRRVSAKIAERIATRLLLDPHEKQRLLAEFERRPRAGDAPFDASASDHLRLTADQFQLIAEWVHYALLSLVRTEGARSEPGWMANRLGVSVRKVEGCLARLQRLGLLDRGADGEWIRAFPSIHTPDDVFNVSLQKAHIADMELAKDRLLGTDVAFRDFTSITLPASPTQLPRAKAAIRRFRAEMTDLLTAEPGSEVYQMTVYLYPLTKVSDGDDFGSRE